MSSLRTPGATLREPGLLAWRRGAPAASSAAAPAACACSSPARRAPDRKCKGAWPSQSTKRGEAVGPAAPHKGCDSPIRWMWPLPECRRCFWDCARSAGFRSDAAGESLDQPGERECLSELSGLHGLFHGGRFADGFPPNESYFASAKEPGRWESSALPFHRVFRKVRRVWSLHGGPDCGSAHDRPGGAPSACSPSCW